MRIKYSSNSLGIQLFDNISLIQDIAKQPSWTALSSFNEAYLKSVWSNWLLTWSEREIQLKSYIMEK